MGAVVGDCGARVPIHEGDKEAALEDNTVPTVKPSAAPTASTALVALIWHSSVAETFGKMKLKSYVQQVPTAGGGHPSSVREFALNVIPLCSVSAVVKAALGSRSPRPRSSRRYLPHPRYSISRRRFPMKHVRNNDRQYSPNKDGDRPPPVEQLTAEQIGFARIIGQLLADRWCQDQDAPALLKLE
jgi:hypothetical protein